MFHIIIFNTLVYTVLPYVRDRRNVVKFTRARPTAHAYKYGDGAIKPKNALYTVKVSERAT